MTEEEPEKLDLRSVDIAEEKRLELLRLFPEIRTEGGKIDFDRLKLALGDRVDAGRERYGLTWPGKTDCFKAIQTPSIGTLRPCPEESVNFDKTENLIIEGDNLEVLKLLQKSYLGKVKLIYIDPPYNTGNDFIYPDNYSETLQTYLEYTGQVDAQGKKFTTNAETDGRFHSKWLGMMWPRLFLARNLLRNDGVIAVSIDDREAHNLRRLLDEIFGPENFVCVFAWQRKDTPANDTQGVSVAHEYVVLFARNAEDFGRNLLPRTEEQLAIYKNPDDDPRGPWTRGTLIRREGDYQYGVVRGDGKEIWPPKGSSWRVAPTTMDRLRRENSLWWGNDGLGDLPFAKKFLSEVQPGVVPTTWWDYRFAGSTRNAKAELKELFPEGAPFDTPKPTKLVQRLLNVATGPDDLVMDFFAGSGTTAHAVLDMNKREEASRSFVLVQLPEETGRADFKTISAIAKERVRRAIALLNRDEPGSLALNSAGEKDRGFRVFRLDESNFKPWDGAGEQDARTVAEQLELHAEHVREDRTPQDILYEILLKSGFPLTTAIQTLSISGKEVFAVSGGEMLVCLEKGLTLELIRGIATRSVGRVVCLDAGFAGNDQLKTNAVQIFKTKGIVFKTV